MITDNAWELTKVIYFVCISTIQFALWSVFLYFFIISMFGWVRRKEPNTASFDPTHTFAILVAAHDEKAVIAQTVQSLIQINYPKHLYDVFVIADNCTDDTAEIARNNGAIVYERLDEVKRGKGFSLEWMFDKLFHMEKQYDAVVILDADNLVSPNFLLEMNKQLCLGHEVIQGYLDSKNPNDSWISGNNSIAFWISNRLIQLPRYYLGLSCFLGGTGFVVKTDVLREIGWGATCLAEDLEFSLKLIAKGKKVYWSHDAVIYDEKPLGLPQSWRQRKRWMQGHFDCMSRFYGKLFTKVVKDHDKVALDAMIYLTQPLIVVFNGFGILIGLSNFIYNIITQNFSTNMVFMGVIMFIFMYLSIAFVIIEGKVSRRVLKYILLMPIYNLTWVPIIIQGFNDRDKKVWVHTEHTRAIDIGEIETENAVGNLEKIG